MPDRIAVPRLPADTMRKGSDPNLTDIHGEAITLMAMPELVARTRNSVLVDAVDPGLVHSDTLRDFRGAAGLLTRSVSCLIPQTFPAGRRLTEACA